MDRVQKHAGRIPLASVFMLQIIPLWSDIHDYIDTQRHKAHPICKVLTLNGTNVLLPGTASEPLPSLLLPRIETWQVSI